MSKKIHIEPLRTDYVNTELKIDNLICVMPKSIVDKLTDVENYKKLDWSTFPRKQNLKNNDIQFSFVNNKRKREVQKGLALRLIKILRLLNKLTNQYKIRYKKKQFDNLYNFSIKTNEFEKILGMEHDELLCLLHNLNILKRVGTYLNDGDNSHPYGYQLNPLVCVESDEYSLIYIVDDTNKKTNKTECVFDNEVLNKLDQRMINTLMTVDMNKQDALTYVLNKFINSEKTKKTLDKLKYRINYIIEFGQRKYLKSGEKVKRIYHHLTYIPGELKQFLSHKFNCVDVKNCQPLLLAFLMRQNNIDFEETFLNDVENGVFYEQFMFLYGGDRKETKIQMYSQILFDFKTYGSLNCHFKIIYPKVWNYLNGINEEKKLTGVTLATKLQNLETAIFSESASYCLSSKYLYTLHDCIYFDGDDTKNVTYHLSQKFKQMGLRASFNLE